jgi:hypothetical protein
VTGRRIRKEKEEEGKEIMWEWELEYVHSVQSFVLNVDVVDN